MRELPDSDTLVRLMNRLPLNLDAGQATSALRDELMALLPGVDRVMIAVDTTIDLSDLDAWRIVELDKQRNTALASHIDSLREQGHAVEEYHPPLDFPILYKSLWPIGTIYLWQELSKPPVSQSTRDLLEALMPFLGYVLSGIVARHHYGAPQERLFRKAAVQIIEQISLNMREWHLLLLRACGFSNAEIGEIMDVRASVIIKLWRVLRGRAGVKTNAELLKKYVAPLLAQWEVEPAEPVTTSWEQTL